MFYIPEDDLDETATQFEFTLADSEHSRIVNRFNALPGIDVIDVETEAEESLIVFTITGANTFEQVGVLFHLVEHRLRKHRGGEVVYLNLNMNYSHDDEDIHGDLMAHESVWTITLHDDEQLEATALFGALDQAMTRLMLP